MTVDTRRRLQLGGVTACWIALAIGNWEISEDTVWLPELIAVFSLVTAVFTGIVLVRPGNEIGYRFGGTLAIGTLFLRVASILRAGLENDDPDVVWVFLSSAGLATLLAITYGYWWLSDVKLWHQLHRDDP